MTMQKYDEYNFIDREEKADVNYRGNKDPLERILDMKDEQIRELRNDLAKKDQEWMEKVEEVRGQLGKEIIRYNYTCIKYTWR